MIHSHSSPLKENILCTAILRDIPRYDLSFFICVSPSFKSIYSKLVQNSSMKICGHFSVFKRLEKNSLYIYVCSPLVKMTLKQVRDLSGIGRHHTFFFPCSLDLSESDAQVFSTDRSSQSVSQFNSEKGFRSLFRFLQLICFFHWPGIVRVSIKCEPTRSLFTAGWDLKVGWGLSYPTSVSGLLELLDLSMTRASAKEGSRLEMSTTVRVSPVFRATTR